MVTGPFCLAVEVGATLFSGFLNFILGIFGGSAPGIVEGVLDFTGCVA